MELREEVEATDVHAATRIMKRAMHMATYDLMPGKIDMNLFTPV